MYEGKIGHWIKHEDLRQGYGEIIKDIYWTCSVCGQSLEKYEHHCERGQAIDWSDEE